MAGSSPAAKAQEKLGLPEGLKTYGPFPFDGMNLSASPLAIEDNEFIWRENFIKLDKGYLRTAWDVGAPIYSNVFGRKVVWYAFYSIALSQYCVIFLDDGSALQLSMATLTTTQIGGPGTFYQAGTGLLPYVRQWGTQYILISNRNTTNDYWVWDGALLYTAGSAAPNGITLTSVGFNYSSIPTYTVFGGHGTGMSLTPFVSNGGIVNVAINNPGHGYQIGDFVQVAFQGGGSDRTPILETNLDAGGVGAVVISAAGSGYTTATVAFTGGGGVGAAGTVQISTGVTSVPITAGGSGYTFATGTFSGGGGSGATATITLSGGSVTAVNITASGSGYTSAPTFTFNGVSGTGATFGTVVIAGGIISGVDITSPGSGYTSAPSVAFSGDGTGATGSALLAPAGLQSVTVVDGGTGFTTVPLITFQGGGGSGATGQVVLTPTSIASINLTAGGSGYTQAPIVSFIGGGGSGATAIAVLNGDTVARIKVTNGGTGYTSPVQVQLAGGFGAGAGGTAVFKPTSIASVIVSSAGQFYTTAPGVVVSPGANNAAYATVQLMPYGVSGSAIETFLSRVWLINPANAPFATIPPGGQFQFSAAGSVTDFATSDGGGAATNTDATLQTQYVNVRQSSGYLYFFGDGSISVISNVATSGAPTVTTYNYQNVDPQAGLSWRNSLQDFGRSTIMMNETGVYGLYGGAATKISQKLDGLFQAEGAKVIFPPANGAVTPSSAIAFIFNRKHYLNLLTVLDPDTNTYRTVMVTWNEKDWCVTSQTVNFTFIATQKVGSKYTAYGTDGTSIFPLFAQPSSSLVKRLDTKYYGTDKPHIIKQLLSVWMEASDLSTGQVGVSGTLTAVVSGLGVQNAAFPSIPNITLSTWTANFVMASPYPYYGLWGTAPNSNWPFTNVGLRLTTSSPDFQLGNWVLGYNEVSGFF